MTIVNTGMSCGAQMRRWLRSGLVSRNLQCCAVLVILLASAIPAAAQRPPRVVPESGDTLVGELPRGYSTLEPASTAGTNGSSGASQGAAADLTRIGMLLEAASMTGDTRLVARADAMLARQPQGSSNPILLRLRAYSAQHKHDFSGAIALLDALVAADPRDASARLSRAEIQLVQGRIGKARSDCAALALGVDADSGLLCIASLQLRTGNYAEAASLLDRLLGGFKPADQRRSFALLMRAEVASRAGEADADALYRQALDASPGDIRTRVSYARHLRRVGHDGEVEALLAGSEQSDTAQLQRTLAAVSAHTAGANALVAAQARRYAIAHAVGTQPEMRDEADFMLVLKGKSHEALALALRNFEQQRDFEDVDVLVRAADAAGEPTALDGLHAWQKSQGLPSTVPAHAKAGTSR
ncbi:MAG: tetratricopeptide repeat protein [Thermomonas sp.]